MGIYFEQGVEAAQQATSWDDIQKCPYDRRTTFGEMRAQLWKNGFIFAFRPEHNAAMILQRFTPNNTITTPLADC